MLEAKNGNQKQSLMPDLSVRRAKWSPMMPEIKVGSKKRESKAEFGARFEGEKSKVVTNDARN